VGGGGGQTKILVSEKTESGYCATFSSVDAHIAGRIFRRTEPFFEGFTESALKHVKTCFMSRHFNENIRTSVRYQIEPTPSPQKNRLFRGL
jgi:hypothetical protein